MSRDGFTIWKNGDKTCARIDNDAIKKYGELITMVYIQVDYADCII